MERPQTGLPSTGQEPSESFSLVAGGPFHVLCCRLGLSSPDLAHAARRSAILAALTWLPLLVLSLASRSFWRGATPVPFAFDFEVHTRFLVALPLLFAAELAVHDRLAKAVRQFVNRDLVSGDARVRFEAIVASTSRWRDGWAGELAVALFVVFAGRAFWLDHLTLDTATWHGVASGGGVALTLPGRWLAWVSVPVFQFLAYRWLYRIALWTALLVRVARLDLRLLPTHPDRAGGLGFLGTASLGFAPLLLAQGVLLAGTIANYIFFEGAKLIDYKVEIAGFTLALLVVVLGPLTAFTPRLARVRRLGLSEYGTLAHQYVRDFDAKWLRGGGGEVSELVGSPDIQSLADLANSYGIVRSMRAVPFGRETALKLAAAVVLPVLPLTLTMIPLEEMVDRLVGVVL